MKNRLLFPSLLSVGLICQASALSPQPKNDSANLDQNLPINQEATEQSIVPGEPALIDPPADTLPEFSPQNVQPLPEAEPTPSGPTMDDSRKKAEAFRAAKTEAEEQPAFVGLLENAFAARTERQKRALLHDYYEAVGAYLIRKSPAFKDDAELWAYGKLSRLSQQQTDPTYVAPQPPASLVKTNAKASASPKPKRKSAFSLPISGN